jgi:hypothetical protein
MVLPVVSCTLTVLCLSRCPQEFCLQGDKEKALGLEVSPMCDREAVVLCNMQMGFIEFVVAPLLIGTSSVGFGLAMAWDVAAVSFLCHLR